MTSMFLIFRKEWRALVMSPVNYLTISMFCVLMGIFFFLLIVDFQSYVMQVQSLGGAAGAEPVTLHEGVITHLYSNLFVLWLFLIPMLTMRLISEERKMQTFILLATSPVKLSHILLGKFGVAMAFVVVLLTVSAIYPLICVVFGNADWGPILSANLGLLLMGSAFVALGLLASSLTQSQVLAAALGFGFILVGWLIGALGEVSESMGIVAQFSLIEHVTPFLKGVIDTYDIAYYLLFTAVILFLAHQALQSERWR